MALRFTNKALDTYRERATNVFVLARWGGVILIILGFGVVAWSLSASGQTAVYGKAAAIGLTLAGWVVILAATRLRRRQLKAGEGIQ